MLAALQSQRPYQTSGGIQGQHIMAESMVLRIMFVVMTSSIVVTVLQEHADCTAQREFKWPAGCTRTIAASCSAGSAGAVDAAGGGHEAVLYG